MKAASKLESQLLSAASVEQRWALLTTYMSPELKKIKRN